MKSSAIVYDHDHDHEQNSTAKPHNANPPTSIWKIMKFSTVIPLCTLLLHATFAQAADEAKLNRDDPKKTRNISQLAFNPESIGVNFQGVCDVRVSSNFLWNQVERLWGARGEIKYKFIAPLDENEEIKISSHFSCSFKAITTTVNHILLKQWLQSEVNKECVALGHDYYGIANIDEDESTNKYLKEDSELILPLSSDPGQKISNSCGIVSRADKSLSEPVPCTVNENDMAISAACNEYLIDPENDSAILPAAVAFARLMDGRPVKIKQVEAESSRTERLAKMAEIEKQRQSALAADEAKKRAEQIERQRIETEKAEQAKAREDREKWLESPAGKRYLAEEAAKKKRAEEDAKKQALAERQRIAKEYPYYAIISCKIQGMHTGIYNCLANQYGGATVIKLKNGEKEDIFQLYDVGRLGIETGDGFMVRLRKSFTLQTQNASEYLIMGVEIFDAVHERLLFERKSLKYERISVKN